MKLYRLYSFELYRLYYDCGSLELAVSGNCVILWWTPITLERPFLLENNYILNYFSVQIMYLSKKQSLYNLEVKNNRGNAYLLTHIFFLSDATSFIALCLTFVLGME